MTWSIQHVSKEHYTTLKENYAGGEDVEVIQRLPCDKRAETEIILIKHKGEYIVACAGNRYEEVNETIAEVNWRR